MQASPSLASALLMPLGGHGDPRSRPTMSEGVTKLNRTETYRRQHRRLLDLAGSISRQLPQGAAAAESIRTELSKLAGVLKLHLAMEDDGLYPSLAESDDAKVRETARAFAEEMGGLAAAFTSYSDRWTAVAIAQDPDAFARETRRIFTALADRIDREDNNLYPLLERQSSAA
jgi:hypothetical protein